MASRPPLTAVVNTARAAELGVTETEALHIQQIASGWSQREIAATEWVAPNSVNTRTWRLRVRLGVRTSEQLIAWAYEQRVLEVRPHG